MQQYNLGVTWRILLATSYDAISTQETRVQSALDDRAWRILLATSQVAVSTQETRVQSELHQVASNIRRMLLATS